MTVIVHRIAACFPMIGSTKDNVAVPHSARGHKPSECDSLRPSFAQSSSLFPELQFYPSIRIDVSCFQDGLQVRLLLPGIKSLKGLQELVLLLWQSLRHAPSRVRSAIVNAQGP
jgi:hypothetical protein